MIDLKSKNRFRYGLTAAVVSCSVVTSMWAANNDSTLYRSVDNWNVDGQHGVVYVSGSLTESPCRLGMASSYQTVEMGNLDIGTLKQNGQGSSVPFQIELEDCVDTPTKLENKRSGLSIWSMNQPAAKIRFLAPTAGNLPNVVKVNGAGGLGLLLTTAKGDLLSIGEASSPQWLSPNQNQLTFYVTPVQTGLLQPGAYSALISFEMQYE